MKQKLALLMTLAASAASLMAQGTVNFQNGGPGVNAIIRDPSAVALDGSAYRADLFWALGTVTDPNSLQSAGFSTAFGTGPSAGYFFGGVAGIPGTAATGGQVITVQVRAWRLADGATWLAASTAGGAQHGQGNLFQVTTGGGPNPPPFFTAMTAFSLTQNPIIPEPSTFVLAGLGIASLLLFRRRK
jgi:hypothetical protein